ncbi:MAG: ATP-binding protein, partial [Candidatus Obscuribacterales bacterium]|nr:ATP-binding protein [Candidatus Obscuribacterales bacterium]
MSEISVESLVRKAFELISVNAQAKDIQLVQRSTALNVFADETFTLQILVNLISNAIKFSEAKRSVEISAEESGNYVIIKVKDHGRGVPEAYKQKIFERFSQVEPEDRSVKGGSGLGLAICKALAEAQSGSLGLDSEMGKGSTFWVKLKRSFRHEEAE